MNETTPKANAETLVRSQAPGGLEQTPSVPGDYRPYRRRSITMVLAGLATCNPITLAFALASFISSNVATREMAKGDDARSEKAARIAKYTLLLALVSFVLTILMLCVSIVGLGADFNFLQSESAGQKILRYFVNKAGMFN